MNLFKTSLTSFVLAMALAGCRGEGGSSDGCYGPPNPPYFSAHTQATGSDTLNITRVAGATAHGTLDLDMTRGPGNWCPSYSGTVTFKTKGLSVGVTETFDPATVAANVGYSGPVLTHLTLYVPPTVADGIYAFSVEAMEAPGYLPPGFKLKVLTTP